MYKLSDLTKNEDRIQTEDIFASIASGQSTIFECDSHRIRIPFSFHRKDQILLNGYQSWTDTRELSINEKMRGVTQIPMPLRKKYAFDQYGDYTFVEYGKKPGQLHGWSYGYIRRGKLFYFAGSLNENDGFTLIRTDTKKDTIFLQKDLEGNSPFENIKMKLFFAIGSERQVFDGYFKALKIASCASRGIKPVFGYTSWYRHYQNISEEKLQNDLKGLATLSRKCDVFQMDDGYQHAVGDWLEIDAHKFPSAFRCEQDETQALQDTVSGSLKYIADSIKAEGLIPGIWLAPFVCEKDSHLYQEHPDWIVHDLSGEPVIGGGNWSGFFSLDIYHPEVRQYIKHVFHTIIHDWGFRLLKLDFLYAVCIHPHAGRNRGQIMSDAMAFLTECIGNDAQILGCGVPLASAFGIVDYCRIGCDASLSYDDVFFMRMMHRERPSTKHTIQNTIFRRQLDGRAFLNDPDVFLLRDDNIKMTPKQKETLAKINALCGSVLFTSDDASTYSAQAAKIFEEMLKLREWKVVGARRNKSNIKLRLKNSNTAETKDFIL